MTDMNTLEIADTVRWLERAVIGLNLCPFAKAPHVKGQIHYVVSEAKGLEGLRDELIEALQAMAAMPAEGGVVVDRDRREGGRGGAGRMANRDLLGLTARAGASGLGDRGRCLGGGCEGGLDASERPERDEHHAADDAGEHEPGRRQAQRDGSAQLAG